MTDLDRDGLKHANTHGGSKDVGEECEKRTTGVKDLQGLPDALIIRKGLHRHDV